MQTLLSLDCLPYELHWFGDFSLRLRRGFDPQEVR
jgi:hypothetical protein